VEQDKFVSAITRIIVLEAFIITSRMRRGHYRDNKPLKLQSKIFLIIICS
jgi:hypothetical protein